MDCDQLKNLSWCMSTCKPRIGVDFLSTARGMLTEDIRRDLRAMMDFEFTQHPTIRMESKRLSALSSLVRQQIKVLLSNEV